MLSAPTIERDRSPSENPTITDEAMFEIVNGQLVEMEPISVYSVRIAALIYGHLFNYCLTHKCGEAVMENLFLLPLAKPRSRRPDVAYVSFDRWPAQKSMPVEGESWHVVPDLAVEILSPHDRANKLERKLNEYFDAGVRHVWVVHPEAQLVEIYKSRYDVQLFKAAEELVDDEILPGFRFRVSAVFPPAEPTGST
jgi:Uma2 family endonuclease